MGFYRKTAGAKTVQELHGKAIGLVGLSTVVDDVANGGRKCGTVLKKI